jgi:hypothetical protein
VRHVLVSALAILTKHRLSGFAEAVRAGKYS